MEKNYSLYVVRTLDDKLYAGISTDVQRRFEEHHAQGPKTAKYLRAHKPQCLVFSQSIGLRSLAQKVEYYFKRLSRVQKNDVVRSKHICFDEISGKIVM